MKRGHKNWRCPYVDNRLRPFIGSGLTYRQVGDILGITHVAVWKAFEVRGWKLAKS